MILTLLCIGKVKDKFILSLCNEYLKRISFFNKFELIELKDSNQKNETKAIIEYVELHKDKLFILLDEKGDEYDSINFSKKINNYIQESKDVIFIISGAEGIEKSFKKYFKNKLSLSKFTFPHEFARLLILEQIYRSLMIINNRNYHKE
ncbi:MAG: 23S rRNA (pseudouridine(1915)-N(3))-methyltransferase RlmH [Candidatus Woesearchaeota archaeon]